MNNAASRSVVTFAIHGSRPRANSASKLHVRAVGRRYPKSNVTVPRATRTQQRVQQLQQQQRRYESTAKSTSTSSTTSSSDAVGNEEAIRQTKEAIRALKDARARTASEAIVKGATALTSSSNKQSSSANSMWSQLRTPALFGVGLYLGLVLFGEHRESKKGSNYLKELKASFDDVDKKR